MRHGGLRRSCPIPARHRLGHQHVQQRVEKAREEVKEVAKARKGFAGRAKAQTAVPMRIAESRPEPSMNEVLKCL